MKIEHEPEVFRLGEGQICIPLGAKEIAVLTDNDSFQSKIILCYSLESYSYCYYSCREKS